MLAPRVTFLGGVAVIMKSTRRTLTRGTVHEQRAIALAKRLGIEMPPQPVTNAQWLKVWVEIGKALLPTEPPKPETLNQLWADIGMYLAELREPEFQWGPGRKPGSKSIKPRLLVAGVSKEALRQRRSRQRKRDREFTGN
jgi:hypothetical protein